MESQDSVEFKDPINVLILTKLIYEQNYKIDLLLKYSEEVERFLVYAVHEKKVLPVYSQRGEHRAFVDLKRALYWAAETGFRRARLTVDYLLND